MKILPCCYAEDGADVTACGRYIGTDKYRIATPLRACVTCVRCLRVLAGEPIDWPDD